MRKVTFNISDNNYSKISELQQNLHSITKTAIINTAINEFFNNDADVDDAVIIEALRKFNLV